MAVTKESILIKDFNRICRTCLSTQDLHPIYGGILEASKLTSILHKYTEVKLDYTDKLPKQICSNCVRNLNTAYQFLNNCDLMNKKLLKCSARHESSLQSNLNDTSCLMLPNVIDLTESEIDVKQNSNEILNSESSQNDLIAVKRKKRLTGTSLCVDNNLQNKISKPQDWFEISRNNIPVIKKEKRKTIIPQKDKYQIEEIKIDDSEDEDKFDLNEFHEAPPVKHEILHTAIDIKEELPVEPNQSYNIVNNQLIEQSQTYCDNNNYERFMLQSESLRRRSRTTFNGTQLLELEKEFESRRFVDADQCTEIAKRLNLTEFNVRIWFQNRRSKLKNETISKPKSYSTKVFSTALLPNDQRLTNT